MTDRPSAGPLSLVTGAAGFIGSHLVERLLAAGRHVRGVDSFTGYYDPQLKRANLGQALAHPRFEMVAADITHSETDALVAGAETIFHLAGQPGVSDSWTKFPDYVQGNVVSTQRLLEAARRAGVGRFVLASSSSVYGDTVEDPSQEDDPVAPLSPYGLTKVSAEALCSLYASEWKVPTVALRYFTVYGPRQRPDMAIHRLIRGVLEGRPFTLRGDGTQQRAFTYVDDVVDATLAAAATDIEAGTSINVGAARCVSLTEVMELVEQLSGQVLRLDLREAEPGAVHRTAACTDRARQLLGWEPQTTLLRGIEKQLSWQEASASAPARRGQSLLHARRRLEEIAHAP
ncbi:MAG: UDP-glucose 4-epimerase [Acidimicrobiales bacterium]|nr:UDP-glucose 4-epimerase [Acidimicrobiales bacterium]